MPSLDLTDEEWRVLTMMLAKQPWEVSNPILYKMAQQARRQMPGMTGIPVEAPVEAPPRPDGGAWTMPGARDE